ncbi:arylacetamide deacetylase-like 4 [Electrophorus electricus]|uniref:Alpha/beta hydrolase fold-3 domain-containing protein n=1 Tax=Electrophorus electricus TaxID=8005 RepID=A0A4W4FRR3_ELEEL|nr:arylacetamide deacetylase-like 4 [Electrophorus electricus]
MHIGTAIVITGVAALAAALCLLLIGVVYSEVMNSDIPPGVANRRKLHVVHCVLVGIAVGGRVLERLGLCSQLGFTRWWIDLAHSRKRLPPPGLRIKDLMFSGVPVRVYEPTTTPYQRRRALLYFHGGGWVFGSIDSYDEMCWHIVKETDTTVVSVGYRLAPEHRFPAQLDDCEAATCHFLSVALRDFGVDPRRVAIGGDSAGGNLAAALSQRLLKRRDGRLPPPCAQVLVYPALQMADLNLPSYQQNHAVPMLFRARMAFYFLQYLNGDTSVCQDVLEGRHVPAELRPRFRRWLDPAGLPPEFLGRGHRRPPAVAYDGEVYHVVKEGLQPEVSPLLVEDDVLRLSPPTFVLTCEYDVLRDDGVLFQKRLKDLGVDVIWHHVPDGFHGIISFFGQGPLNFPAGQRAMEQIVNYIKTL